MTNKQLLTKFFLYFRERGEANVGMSIDQFVDMFLNENITEQNSIPLSQAAQSIISLPFDQAVHQIKSTLTGQPITSVIKGHPIVIMCEPNTPTE